MNRDALAWLRAVWTGRWGPGQTAEALFSQGEWARGCYFCARVGGPGQGVVPLRGHQMGRYRCATDCAPDRNWSA